MWIGRMKLKKLHILQSKTAKDPIKTLRAYLSYNPFKNIETNFLTKIRKMKTKINLRNDVFFNQWHRRLERKIRVLPTRVERISPDALPLSYRRLVGAKAIQIGP